MKYKFTIYDLTPLNGEKSYKFIREFDAIDPAMKHMLKLNKEHEGRIDFQLIVDTDVPVLEVEEWLNS